MHLKQLASLPDQAKPGGCLSSCSAPCWIDWEAPSPCGFSRTTPWTPWSIRPTRNAHYALWCLAVMPLACGAWVPPLTPVCLTQSRIKSSNEIAKWLWVHTVHTALLGTEEDPGVLPWIPEQWTFLLLPLVIPGTQWRAEGTNKTPLPETPIRHFNSTIKIMLQQHQPVSLIYGWFRITHPASIDNLPVIIIRHLF